MSFVKRHYWGNRVRLLFCGQNATDPPMLHNSSGHHSGLHSHSENKRFGVMLQGGHRHNGGGIIITTSKH